MSGADGNAFAVVNAEKIRALLCSSETSHCSLMLHQALIVKAGTDLVTTTNIVLSSFH